MTETVLIDRLNERIKELTCLYEISILASENQGSLEDALQAVIKRLIFICFRSAGQKRLFRKWRQSLSIKSIMAS
jgi:hypothetical protein